MFLPNIFKTDKAIDNLVPIEKYYISKPECEECRKTLIERIFLEQFGDSSYGKEKYSKAALFWIGYMYRYIAYTREEETSYIMKLFNHKQGAVALTIENR